jgi:hypothetical protein
MKLKSFREIYFECNVYSLIEQTLREMKIRPKDVASIIFEILSRKTGYQLVINGGFYENIVKLSIKHLINQNKDNEGLILIKDENLNYINEKSSILIGIRAFAEAVCQCCVNTCKDWKDNLSKEQQIFKKYFENPSDYATFTNLLIGEIAKNKPYNTNTTTNTTGRVGPPV